jgi:hypothetical protein
LTARIGKLQTELMELKDNFAKQSIMVQQMKNDGLVDKARVMNLERKILAFQAGNKGGSSSTEEISPKGTQISPSELSYQSFSPELFNNPEFAKLFHDQVNQVIKDIQKEEQEARIQQANVQMQERMAKRIEDFAKAQNLNDFQKQEFTKILNEQISKSTELMTKMRNQELKQEDFRAQTTALRNESDEKIKQVLMPAQYDEYKKIANQFGQGGGGMRGRAPGNRPGTTPQEQR